MVHLKGVVLYVFWGMTQLIIIKYLNFSVNKCNYVEMKFMDYYVARIISVVIFRSLKNGLFINVSRRKTDTRGIQIIRDNYYAEEVTKRVPGIQIFPPYHRNIT